MMLTMKQEKFCQSILEGYTQREAYKSAYDWQGMGENSMDVEACRMMQNPKIALRIEELRDELAIKSLWKRVDSVQRLKKVATNDAAQDKDIVAAVKALNSMYGWDKQTIDHTSSDHSMSPKGRTLDDFYDEN